MVAQLTKPELLGKVLQGLRDGGWLMSKCMRTPVLV